MRNHQIIPQFLNPVKTTQRNTRSKESAAYACVCYQDLWVKFQLHSDITCLMVKDSLHSHDNYEFLFIYLFFFHNYD
jgi:hypothetical protein